MDSKFSSTTIFPSGKLRPIAFKKFSGVEPPIWKTTLSKITASVSEKNTFAFLFSSSILIMFVFNNGVAFFSANKFCRIFSLT